jgi:hypothetical protein
MNTLISLSHSYQQPVWSVCYHSRVRHHTQAVPKRRGSYSQWRKRLMNARAVSLLITAALLSLSLLPSTAAAVDPEKQPIYVNIMNFSLCGTDPSGPEPPSPCQVPAGYRLIFEHVSGYAFRPTSADTTLAVSIAIKDPKLGLGGIGELAFHTFVATKTPSGSAVTDTFAFSTPFRIMLHSGATFYFSPADNVGVSGYLVKE